MTVFPRYNTPEDVERVIKPITPRQAPQQIQSAEVVIVGGGPCGSFLAAALEQRGVPVTVIEKTKDFSKYDISRTYSMKLNWRTRKAFRSLPDLHETIAEKSVPTRFIHLHLYKPDKQNAGFSIQNTPIDGLPDLRILRPSLVQQLRNFVATRERVTKLYGTEVKDVKFDNDGYMQLLLETDGEEHTLRSRLVISCDGKNSVVAQKLDEAEKEGASNIANSKGPGRACYNSPAVGLNLRAIRLHKDAIDQFDDLFKEETVASDPDLLRVYGGERKNRSTNRIFNLGVFVQTREDIERANAVTANVIRPANHDVWKLKSVEEAYVLFEENLPQVDVRKLISADAMAEFISAGPSPFPIISRRNSLVARIGRGGEGGVLFCGDAAHNFPPDTGEGVNSGMEDIDVFCDLLDKADPEASIESILAEYERLRDPEITGIINMSRFAAPYQYRQSQFGALCAEMNAMVRKKLSQMFPSVLHPSMRELMWSEFSYSEIDRRTSLTTTRLQLGAASLLLVPVLGVMASRMLS